MQSSHSMKTVTHSHEGGVDRVNMGIRSGIERVLHAIKMPLRKNCAPKLRREITKGLHVLGWSDRVPIRAKVKLTVTAINDRVGLCLQTGNMARFYADLLKLQVAFLDGNIRAAILVLPTREAARSMGSNIASFERLVKELDLFKRIITIPLIVIGFSQGGD